MPTSEWNPQRRCTGTSRSGERCWRQPVPGANVCVAHGGAAPQVQRAAKMRLLAGADLAVDYLLNLLTPKPPCEHCGRSDADRDPVVVRACQLVLDRSGFHPSLSVELTTPAPNPFEHLNEDELVRELERLLDTAREFKRLRDESNRILSEPALLDAYVVPDDDDDDAACEPATPQDATSTSETPDTGSDTP